MALSPMQAFFWGEGGEKLTPDQVEERRARAMSLRESGSDYSPVGHWLQGLARATQGVVGGIEGRRADAAEREGLAEAEAWRERLNAEMGLSPVAQALVGSGVGSATGGAPVGGDIVSSLVQSESGGNWNALNGEGYGGRLQFGDARLADAAAAGIIPAGVTGAQFSQMSPDQQMAVENWHFGDIDRQAGDMGLGQYIGQTVGGVSVTQDAIRGMAHLGGIGGAARFLQSGGQYNPSDSNGTSLSDYGVRHGGAAPATSGSPSIVALLAEGAGNPWVRQQYGGVVDALMGQELQRQQQASDPLRQLQIQRAQLDLDRMRNPAREPIKVGDMLVDPVTFEPLFDGRSPDQTSGMQNFEYLRGLGLDEQAALDRAFSGGVTVNMPGQPNIGAIPQGYQALQGQDGGWSMSPIPGGPADQASQEAAQAGNRTTSTDIITNAASLARSLSDGFWNTGLPGALSGLNPASEASELQRQVEVLKSNAKVENLQAMRAASPTGGALGAVSDSENAMLAAKSGALDPRSPRFPQQLDDYERTLLRIVHGPQAGDAIFDQTRPQQGAQQRRRRWSAEGGLQ